MYLYVCIYVYTYVYIYEYVYLHTNTFMCLYACLSVHESMYRFMHFYIYMQDTCISGEVVKEYSDVHRGSIYAMDYYRYFHYHDQYHILKFLLRLSL
jgi:hypothetical protein